MTIKELLEMEIHEEYVFNHGIVIRVPGGWIYEIETPKDGAYPGGMTSLFCSRAKFANNHAYKQWI